MVSMQRKAMFCKPCKGSCLEQCLTTLEGRGEDSSSGDFGHDPWKNEGDSRGVCGLQTLAFGHGNEFDQDMGGSTFDVSVLTMKRAHF